jgi:hypothetical protein
MQQAQQSTQNKKHKHKKTCYNTMRPAGNSIDLDIEI